MGLVSLVTLTFSNEPMAVETLNPAGTWAEMSSPLPMIRGGRGPFGGVNGMFGAVPQAVCCQVRLGYPPVKQPLAGCGTWTSWFCQSFSVGWALVAALTGAAAAVSAAMVATVTAPRVRYLLRVRPSGLMAVPLLTSRRPAPAWTGQIHRRHCFQSDAGAASGLLRVGVTTPRLITVLRWTRTAGV